MPAYNAARTLERTYADIPHDLVHHMILVDDVSKDETDRDREAARHRGHRPSPEPGLRRQPEDLLRPGARVGRGRGGHAPPGLPVRRHAHPAAGRPDPRRRAGPDAGQPLPGRPAGGRHAEVEVHLQPLPDRPRERRVRAPPVRVPHRPPRLQPAPARDDPVPPQLGRLRVRPGADRPGRGGGRPAGRRDRGARRGTSRRPAPSGSGGASCTACPRCGSSAGTCCTGRGCGDPPSCGRGPLTATRPRPDMRLRGGRSGGRRSGSRSASSRWRWWSGRWTWRRPGGAPDRRSRWIGAHGRLHRPRRAPARGPVAGAAGAGRRRVAAGTSLGSLLVGYLANNVLPARLGEVVRSHDLGSGRGSAAPRSSGPSSWSGSWTRWSWSSIAAVAILVLSVRGVVASAVLVGAAVTALLVVAIALGIVAHRLPGAERVTAVIARWPRIHMLLVRLRTGLAIAGNLRTMTVAVALSIGVVVVHGAGVRGRRAGGGRASRRSARRPCWRPGRTWPPRSRRRPATWARSSWRR